MGFGSLNVLGDLALERRKIKMRSFPFLFLPSRLLSDIPNVSRFHLNKRKKALFEGQILSANFIKSKVSKDSIKAKMKITNEVKKKKNREKGDFVILF